jgi:hypothetical protein
MWPTSGWASSRFPRIVVPDRGDPTIKAVVSGVFVEHLPGGVRRSSGAYGCADFLSRPSYYARSSASRVAACGAARRSLPPVPARTLHGLMAHGVTPAGPPCGSHRVGHHRQQRWFALPPISESIPPTCFSCPFSVLLRIGSSLFLCRAVFLIVAILGDAKELPLLTQSRQPSGHPDSPLAQPPRFAP